MKNSLTDNAKSDILLQTKLTFAHLNDNSKIGILADSLAKNLEAQEYIIKKKANQSIDKTRILSLPEISDHIQPKDYNFDDELARLNNKHYLSCCEDLQINNISHSQQNEQIGRNIEINKDYDIENQSPVDSSFRQTSTSNSIQNSQFDESVHARPMQYAQSYYNAFIPQQCLSIQQPNSYRPFPIGFNKSMIPPYMAEANPQTINPVYFEIPVIPTYSQLIPVNATPQYVILQSSSNLTPNQSYYQFSSPQFPQLPQPYSSYQQMQGDNSFQSQLPNQPQVSTEEERTIYFQENNINHANNDQNFITHAPICVPVQDTYCTGRSSPSVQIGFPQQAQFYCMTPLNSNSTSLNMNPSQVESTMDQPFRVPQHHTARMNNQYIIPNHTNYRY